MSTLANVTVSKRANLYFDGKCVSHNVTMADGTKKSVGVIFPSTLTFNTGVTEVMEIVGGQCRVRLDGASDWNDYAAGQLFSIGANSSFDIETIDTVEYVCHFG